MTELDFRSVAADALVSALEGFKDDPALVAADKIRAGMAWGINTQSIGLLCGHEQCFRAALAAIFHSVIILGEQEGVDLLTDVRDAINAASVIRAAKLVVDSCSPSPDDTAPPAGDVGEPDTRTVPPDGAGVGDLPGADPGESSTGIVSRPTGASADDLTPPHGIVRPSAGRISRDGRVFVPVIGEPEFNVIPFPTPAVMPSPLDAVGRALFEAGRRVVRRYRRKT